MGRGGAGRGDGGGGWVGGWWGGGGTNSHPLTPRCQTRTCIWLATPPPPPVQAMCRRICRRTPSGRCWSCLLASAPAPTRRCRWTKPTAPRSTPTATSPSSCPCPPNGNEGCGGWTRLGGCTWCSLPARGRRRGRQRVRALGGSPVGVPWHPTCSWGASGGGTLCTVLCRVVCNAFAALALAGLDNRNHSCVAMQQRQEARHLYIRVHPTTTSEK